MILKKLLNYFRKKREKKPNISYTYGVGVNRCICCGLVIPEGRQVCVKCEWGLR